MMLDVPADARVQILIQPAGEAGTALAPPPPVLEERGNGGKRLLQVGFCLAIFLGAFLAGQQTATHNPGRTSPALAQTVAPTASPTGTDALPPAFREQLQRPPAVTPPPGAPATGHNPFGLEE